MKCDTERLDHHDFPEGVGDKPAAHSAVAQFPGGVSGFNQLSSVGEPVDLRNPSGSVYESGFPSTY